MGLNARTAAGSKPRTPPLESGTYPGRFVQIVDMGLQPREYRGDEKEPAREIMLTYELVDEFLLDEDGHEMTDKPRWASETMPLFNLESEKAKSTARYKALDPNEVADGDFTKLLGTPIMVTVVQNPKGERVYVNVAGISPMREKDANKCPDLVNEPRVFDLDSPDMEVFDQFPDWVQKRITTNLEYRGSKLEEMMAGREVEQKEETAGEAEETDDRPY
jgi:hypothetical protein